jgi:hypothetical protein
LGSAAAVLLPVASRSMGTIRIGHADSGGAIENFWRGLDSCSCLPIGCLHGTDRSFSFFGTVQYGQYRY